MEQLRRSIIGPKPSKRTVRDHDSKVQAQTEAPLNTGTGQKSVSQTGSKLAREAPRHACRHLPRRRPKAAAGGGAGQRVLDTFRVSFEPV